MLPAFKAWGVHDVGNDTSWPTLYVVGPEGRIAWRGLTDDDRTRPPTAEVLAAVDRL